MAKKNTFEGLLALAEKSGFVLSCNPSNWPSPSKAYTYVLTRFGDFSLDRATIDCRTLREVAMFLAGYEMRAKVEALIADARGEGGASDVA